jgi:hypothetical protein
MEGLVSQQAGPIHAAECMLQSHLQAVHAHSGVLVCYDVHTCLFLMDAKLQTGKVALLS